VTEETAWDHPTFLAGTTTFCAFEIVRARPSVAFRLPPSTVARLVRRTHFFATPYGRGAWVSRWLDVDIDWREMAALVTDSHEHALIAAPVRARRPSAQ
jgi:predicted DNA-binding protein (MmcQ/YjbR family)